MQFLVTILLWGLAEHAHRETVLPKQVGLPIVASLETLRFPV